MVHVLRAANNVAHCLANEASSKVIDSVWLEDMPSVIFRMLYLGSILVPRSHFLDQFLLSMKRFNFVKNKIMFGVEMDF
jgi:hypothetical protein